MIFFPEKTRDFDSITDLYRTLTKAAFSFFLPGRATSSHPAPEQGIAGKRLLPASG
jgi:hypothetical protein